MDAKGARWVCVSNYRELRLYAVGYGRKDYEVFDLSNLSNPKDYARFILLLSAKNLLGGTTYDLLKESEKIDKEITDQLYSDYKDLRANLIKKIGDDNPHQEPIEVVQFAQTILDRVLFIAFAEDKGLLPKDTLKQAYATKNPYNPQPIWENFKGLFHAIDKGNSELNIPAYNGGLFKQTLELDTLNISDELCQGFKRIGDYDFESDVSVNILGHIFEQSISDLEEIKAKAEGIEEPLDKKKSKKKKDGVFYTPPYITRYIVELAVGGWLNDRKKELAGDSLPEITEEEFDLHRVDTKSKSFTKKTTQEFKTKRQQIAKKVRRHIDFWEAYKNTLSKIRVLDPACGSGAFLNEVFDYLKKEGEAVNSQLAYLKNEQISLFRWDTHILANNIYGVDLNSESVEITKLSLWLKTANRQEKLTYLEDNIKVGNSLIDDHKIAGDLAFNWSSEFSEIIQTGKFDVIVGNPPYVLSRDNIFDNFKDYVGANYSLVRDKINLYILFIELGFSLLKDKGYLSYIVPNSVLGTDSAMLTREFLLEKVSLNTVLNLLGNTFDGANVEAAIFCASNTINKKNIVNFKNIYSATELETPCLSAPQEEWKKIESYIFDLQSSGAELETIKKIEAHAPLSNFYEVKAGLQAYEKGKGTPKQTARDVKDHIYDYDHKYDEDTFKYLEGKDVLRYDVSWSGKWLRYGKWLSQPRDISMFSGPRVLIREITGKYPKLLQATYVEGTFLNNKSIINILALDNDYLLKFVLCILNSSLMGFYHSRRAVKGNRSMFPKAVIKDVNNYPIPRTDIKRQTKFVNKANSIIKNNEMLNSTREKLGRLIKSEFRIDRMSKKLEIWYELSFFDFIAELEKSIKPAKLSLSQKSEWMEYFEKEKARVLDIKSEIDQTDCEIDKMVYELYGLTTEDIKLIEKP
ncbi:type II endonuclease-methyltransferasefusion protein [Kordiimonas sediminis]|uniref:site-specific DNA-methyltransferase (adenine-specific) n=1 Tax=Kordiimonas sediminis TaxID=1735581 RepID=A0A919AP52_9PROT|nr:N-6 DNA methylase [Kordiimonas sediminis]GHF16604.1 type II endonuclease-methyltransferasefusion protein [Kordiimonas sediminis]